MEVDFSGCRFQQTEDALDECCLTASVRTDDAQKVPFVNVQVDVVEYGTAVVSGSKVLYFDNRFIFGELLRLCIIRSLTLWRPVVIRGP